MCLLKAQLTFIRKHFWEALGTKYNSIMSAVPTKIKIYLFHSALSIKNKLAPIISNINCTLEKTNIFWENLSNIN